MELKKIKEIFSFEKGSLQSSKCTAGEYNFITASSEWKTHNSFDYDCEALIVAVAASGSLGRVHYVNDKFISSDLCFVLKPKDSNKFPVNLEFYYSIFKSLKEDLVKSTATGTAKKSINKTNFGNYVIPYYNIEEQNRLKPVFEKVADNSEKINQELSNQKQLVSKLKQAILQEAIQGKLTHQWREQNHNTEPASELLERIKAEKKQLIKDKKIRKEKPLPPITEEEIPFEIPESWVWCRVGNITNVGTGATPLTSNKSYYSNGKIPWVTSSATGNLFVEKPENFITEKALNETNCNLNPKGTLVVAMYGQGKTRGQITELMFESATNQACATIQPYLKEVENRRFIKLYFQNIYLEIRKLAQGGAQPNLNMAKIKNTVIPIPPLEEQKTIVEKVETLMQKCSALEKEITQSEQHANMLMQAVLKEAFERKVIDN